MQCSLGLDSTPWIPDSRYWIPVFVSGTRILDSLSCIPDCKTQNPEFHKQKFFHIPDSTSKILPIPESGFPYTGSVVSREAVLSIIRIKVAPGI